MNDLSENSPSGVVFPILHGWIRSGIASIRAVVDAPTAELVAERLRDRPVAAILEAIRGRGDQRSVRRIAAELMTCDPEKARIAHVGRSSLRIVDILEKSTESKGSVADLARQLRPALTGRHVERVDAGIVGDDLSLMVESLLETDGADWSDEEARAVAEYVATDPNRAVRLSGRLRATAPSPVIPNLSADEATQLAAALESLEGMERNAVRTELAELDRLCGLEIDWDGLYHQIGKIRRREEDRVQSVFEAFAKHLNNGRFDAVFPDRDAIVHYILRIARNKEARRRTRAAEESQRRERGEGRPLEQQNPIVDFGSGVREYEHADSAAAGSSEIWGREIEERLAWVLCGWRWDAPNGVRRDPRKIVLGLLAEDAITDAAKQSVGRTAGCSSRNVDKHWYRFAGEFLAGLRNDSRAIYDAVVGGRRNREIVEALVVCGDWDKADLATRAGHATNVVTDVRRRLSEHLHGILRRVHLRTPWDDVLGEEEENA